MLKIAPFYCATCSGGSRLGRNDQRHMCSQLAIRRSESLKEWFSDSTSNGSDFFWLFTLIVYPLANGSWSTYSEQLYSCLTAWHPN